MTSAINSVTGSSTTDTSSVSAASGTTATSTNANGALGKDAFLKLLVAQLKQQDPLNPVQGSDFIAQLSQFSAVEQSIQQTKSLDGMSTQLSGLANSDAVGLVGKSVTLRGGSLAWDGSTPATTNANLAAQAKDVTIEIKNAAGKTVKTLDLGAKPAGPINITWNGKDDSGAPVPPGAYTASVNAVDAKGASIVVNRELTGTVNAVTYENGYPEVVLDGGTTAPISDLVRVATAQGK